MNTPTLEVTGLNVSYGSVRAVRGASLTLGSGEVVCLIGETGSGKSSMALAAARLLPGGATVSGSVRLHGQELLEMDRRDLCAVRAHKIGFVAQDSMAALNPVHKVGAQIAELFRLHKGYDRKRAWDAALETLDWVWIQNPRLVAKLYPHQLSGGMRQRAMIALALALEPPLIVADEPTTALDVSTQAEIIALIARLRRELEAAVLWITHDMGVVAEMADRVAVMYAGRIVEQAGVGDLFQRPRHHYTAALLRTLHDLRGGQRGERMYQVNGQPPGPGAEIPGCPFHPRCPAASERCRTVEPGLEPHEPGAVACHYPLLQSDIGGPEALADSARPSGARL